MPGALYMHGSSSAPSIVAVSIVFGGSFIDTGSVAIASDIEKKKY